MQKIAGRLSPRGRPIAAASKAAGAQRAMAAPSLADVWRNSIATFITQAAPLLLVGVIGFAVVPLLSSVLAWVSAPLTHIAITHLTRHGNLLGPGRRAAFAMNWVYATVLLAGQLGISVPLRAWGFNLNFAEQRSTSWGEAAHSIALRSVNALVNTSALPFHYALFRWRNQAFEAWSQLPDAAAEQKRMAAYWQRGPDAANGAGIAGMEAQARTNRLTRPDLRLIFVCSLMLLVVAETMLVFRSLPTGQPARLLWLSLRRASAVAGHWACLRLALVAFKALFVFMPIAVRNLLAQYVGVLRWFDGPIQGMTLVICLTVIDAIALTVEAVYVATLYGSLHDQR